VPACPQRLHIEATANKATSIDVLVSSEFRSTIQLDDLMIASAATRQRTPRIAGQRWVHLDVAIDGPGVVGVDAIISHL
jgi:hypothetical protein